MKSNKNWQAVVSSLRGITSRGGVDLKQVETLEALVRKADHAIVINDRKMLRKVWNELARELCKTFVQRGE